MEAKRDATLMGLDSGSVDYLCIGINNGSMAADNATAHTPDYASQLEAVHAHARNVLDTCQEYDASDIETARALRSFAQSYLDEVTR